MKLISLSAKEHLFLLLLFSLIAVRKSKRPYLQYKGRLVIDRD